MPTNDEQTLDFSGRGTESSYTYGVNVDGGNVVAESIQAPRNPDVPHGRYLIAIQESL